jgi:hypothetical protein
MMKGCCDALSTWEAGIKIVEHLDTLTQMPRFVQPAISFQLPKEARQRILNRHFAAFSASTPLL